MRSKGWLIVRKEKKKYLWFWIRFDAHSLASAGRNQNLRNVSWAASFLDDARILHATFTRRQLWRYVFSLRLRCSMFQSLLCLISLFTWREGRCSITSHAKRNWNSTFLKKQFWKSC
jgi:hypothetical protein